MTEQGWQTSPRAWDLIDFVGPSASARKFRLFACACCRSVLNPFAPPLVPRVVEAAEAFADSEISAEVLARVREVVAEAAGSANREDTANGTGYLSHVLGTCLCVCSRGHEAEMAQDASHAAANAAADIPLSRTAPGQRAPLLAERNAEHAAQADLFRDIFGNPFRSSEIDLEWLTDTVVALARGIYAGRAFDGMPILADALQEAGCDDDDILTHCREPGEHVRGCWVVDLLLGKR